MIKKLETQDQYGNKIYRYTSSDIVLDLDTGHTVKQDIDTLMSALGISQIINAPQDEGIVWMAPIYIGTGEYK